MNNTLNKINNIPMRTWRWLGVNNITIDRTLPEPKEYTLSITDELENSEVKVELMKKDTSSKFLPSNYEGLNEASLEQCKNNYNTGIYVNSIIDRKATKPVFINYNADEKNDLIIDNNLIIAEENSEVTVVINYSSQTSAFHNGLTQVYAKKGSIVNLIKIQELSDNSIHLDANVAKVEDNAVVNYVEVNLGSLFNVTNYRADLNGYKSNGNIHSIYLGDKERDIDINYLINHYGKETKSNIEARGALLDESKKVFKGTLDFKKGSVKSKGQEEEYTVLLSPNVKNRSVPILLCTEEDVDGQHAASAGRIDENRLFYIMSRGFSEAEAKKLIIEAAFNPIIDKIPSDELKSNISNSIRRKLSDE
ncbi:Fe-S cluster assembly protein SufD [Clostridium neuense]|uniref:Fe-S cluster assembly protein SufD n=1 Tax=Clostridium neuense TaxID=1728934 RepID=A0ABW8TL42_9CLOT